MRHNPKASIYLAIAGLLVVASGGGYHPSAWAVGERSGLNGTWPIPAHQTSSPIWLASTSLTPTVYSGAKTWGGGGDDMGEAVAVDGAGNVYVSGLQETRPQITEHKSGKGKPAYTERSCDRVGGIYALHRGRT